MRDDGDTQNKRTVVMAGPLPPAIGGMATVIGDISASPLRDAVSLVLFDTAKSTAEGRTLFEAVIARFQLWHQWLQVLKTAPGTIAHIHTCSGLTYFLDGTLVLLARLSGHPAALHVHGARFDQFLSQLSPQLRWIAQWLARRADRIIVLSEAWHEKLAPLLPGTRMVVIPNGVPQPSATPCNRSQGKTVTVLFLGNLGERKGALELVEALSSIPDNVHLIMVGGEEDPGITKRIQRRADQLGLRDRIELVGPVYGDSKHNWLRKADIFALPSRAEGLPISLLEAMMAGLPVVVSPVGAIPSVVTDQQEGLFVPAGNVDALSTALQRLARDPQLRTRMGAAGQKRSMAAYSIDRVITAYLKLYNDIALPPSH